MLLTADVASWTIVQASENADAIIGCAVQDVLGTSLAELIGDDAVGHLSAVLRGELEASNPTPVLLNSVPFDAIVHAADGVAVIEFEPMLPHGQFSSAAAVYAALRRLGALSSRDELWEAAARELQQLSRFDRVVVYHFHPDGHGQIVAERRSDDTMESYLGLHYPATVVPAEAQNLCLTTASRTIASTDEISFALLPIENPLTRNPLDLSGAELRSASPHHLQFMRNMGQAATLSFSLTVGGELVGMITCAHRTPRRLPYALRQALGVFAGQVAGILGSMSEISRLVRATEVLALRKKLVEQLSASDDPVQTLLSGPVTMFDLVPASAAAIKHGRRISIAGDLSDRSVERFVQQLFADGGHLPFASESLASEYPELAEILPAVAGVLIVPFGVVGDYLAWFRPEMTETIDWLGNQSDSNRDSPVSSRDSLSAWRGSVAGVAEPWGTVDAEAIDLGRDLNSVFRRKMESKLARFALHDALTGLPNRRLLMDRLELALAGRARADDIAVLFIDIDSFKRFNDSLGHGGGDAVLAQIAERLLLSARTADTVARLGGDEFVVLCEDANAETARRIAERILSSLRRPLIFDGQEVPVTASIGVATAQPGDTAADVIRRADMSMYQAKRSGKDRAGE